MALSLSPAEITARGQYPLLVKADHWERVCLGEVATVQNGFPFKSELFDREGGVPLVRIRDIESAQTEHRYTGTYDAAFVVEPGDLLIGMDGDFRAAKWRGPRALLNQRVCRIESKSNVFHPSFFFLALQPYHLNAINAETSSVTVKHLSSRTIEDVPLPLPPYSEQLRIASKIEELFSELDASAESLTLARAQLKSYRHSLLKAAFEGKLTAGWRAAYSDNLMTPDELLKRLRDQREERYSQDVKKWTETGNHPRGDADNESLSERPTKPDWPERTTFPDLPRPPGGWAYVPFECLAYSIRNGISQKPDEKGALKIFRISAVRPMEFDLSDHRFIGDQEEYRSFKLSRNDLVFTRYNGSRAYVGVGALYRGDGSHVYPDKLIRCDVRSDYADPEYLEKAVNCGASRSYIEQRIRTTAGQAGISGADLKGMPVPVCGIAEQKEINRAVDSRLSVTKHLEAEIEVALAKITALRQSILKRAFSGQLVPQEPSDEPATALLARIRAQTVDTNSGRKGRRKQFA